MADNTRIAWCDATWSPFRGCSRVSPGCQNCYAERMCSRGLPGLKSPTTGEDFATKTQGGPRWTGRVELIEDALEIPLRWRRPRRIFVSSMSDTFHESVPDGWIDRMFAVMALCPQHTFFVCTKRVGRARKWSSRPFLAGDVQVHANDLRSIHHVPWPHLLRAKAGEFSLLDVAPEQHLDMSDVDNWPPLNVVLLASVEDQPRADDRIPDLLATPAAVRGISLEPMLGPVDLTSIAVSGIYRANALSGDGLDGNRLSWVIVGGESGPGARPCNIDWIRDVVRQCREAGVACFVKQLGARPERYMGINAALELQRFAGTDPDSTYHIKLKDRAGADPAEWPEDLRVQEWPEVRRG